MSTTIFQNYKQQNGVDLRSNAIKRDPTFAQDLRNTEYSNDDILEKRKGGKIFANSSPAHGVYTYDRVNPETGARESQVVGVNHEGKLLKRMSTVLTVSYTGSATACLVRHYFDPANAKFYFRTEEDGAEDLKVDLGSGLEGSPITIANLITSITADADYGASYTGDNSVPAAFLEIVKDEDLKSGALTLTAHYWEEIHKPDSSKIAFFTAVAEKNSEDFENASFIQNKNVCYLADGGFPYKYDGQAYYKAGLPGTPADSGFTVTNQAGASGLTIGEAYKWLVRYEYLDGAGNYIFGKSVESASMTPTGGNPHARMTLNNLIPSTQYPTFWAKVNGNQAGISTVTVNSGHNLKAGMWLVMFDQNVGVLEWAMHKITSVTATSITFSPGTIDLNNNDLIFGSLIGSEDAVANRNPFYNGYAYDGPMRITIYRTKGNGSTYYLTPLGLQTFASGDAATQTIDDTATDAQLGAEYTPPSYEPEIPRACKYLSKWQGQIVQAGRPYQSTIDELLTRNIPSSATEYYGETDFCALNSAYWADVETFEGFPRGGLHEESLDTHSGFGVSGIGPSKDSFFVFDNRSMMLLAGEVGLNNIRKEVLEADVGCAAHATIQDVQGMLVWLDEVQGFQSIVAGRLPISIGIPVNPLIKDNAKSGSTRLNLKRAVAHNYDLRDKYICTIPAESLSGSNRYTNGNLKTLVFDYAEIEINQRRRAWHIWDIDGSGGITTISDELFYVQRGYDGSALTRYLWKRSELGDAWDYEDHNASINWVYFMGWLHINKPSIKKSFPSLFVQSTKDTQTAGFALTVNQYLDFISSTAVGNFTKVFDFSANVNQRGHKLPLPKDDAQALAVKFSNSQDQVNVAITGWEIEVEDSHEREFQE